MLQMCHGAWKWKTMSWNPGARPRPGSIRRLVRRFAGKPGGTRGPIYPLRARRRPRRVRGSSVSRPVCVLLMSVGLYVAVCMCFSLLLPDPGVPGQTCIRTSVFQLFFRIVFWMVFGPFWHRFWVTFWMIFACFLYSFFDTYF